MTILKGEALFTLNAITFVLLINMLKSPFAVSLLTVILIVAKHPTSLAISDAHLHLVTFLGQNVRSPMTSVYNSRLQFIAQSKSSFNFPLGNSPSSRLLTESTKLVRYHTAVKRIITKRFVLPTFGWAWLVTRYECKLSVNYIRTRQMGSSWARNICNPQLQWCDICYRIVSHRARVDRIIQQYKLTADYTLTGIKLEKWRLAITATSTVTAPRLPAHLRILCHLPR